MAGQVPACRLARRTAILHELYQGPAIQIFFCDWFACCKGQRQCLGEPELQSHPAREENARASHQLDFFRICKKSKTILVLHFCDHPN